MQANQKAAKANAATAAANMLLQLASGLQEKSKQAATASEAQQQQHSSAVSIEEAVHTPSTGAPHTRSGQAFQEQPAAAAAPTTSRMMRASALLEKPAQTILPGIIGPDCARSHRLRNQLPRRLADCNRRESLGRHSTKPSHTRSGRCYASGGKALQDR